MGRRWWFERRLQSRRLLPGFVLAGGDLAADFVEPVEDDGGRRGGRRSAAGKLEDYEVLAVGHHIVRCERSARFEAA